MDAVGAQEDAVGRDQLAVELQVEPNARSAADSEVEPVGPIVGVEPRHDRVTVVQYGEVVAALQPHRVDVVEDAVGVETSDEAVVVAPGPVLFRALCRLY